MTERKRLKALRRRKAIAKGRNANTNNKSVNPNTQPPTAGGSYRLWQIR